MSLDMLGIGSIIEGVGKVADDLFTSDEERLRSPCYHTYYKGKAHGQIHALLRH